MLVGAPPRSRSGSPPPGASSDLRSWPAAARPRRSSSTKPEREGSSGNIPGDAPLALERRTSRRAADATTTASRPDRRRVLQRNNASPSARRARGWRSEPLWAGHSRARPPSAVVRRIRRRSRRQHDARRPGRRGVNRERLLLEQRGRMGEEVAAVDDGVAASRGRSLFGRAERAHVIPGSSRPTRRAPTAFGSALSAPPRAAVVEVERAKWPGSEPYGTEWRATSLVESRAERRRRRQPERAINAALAKTRCASSAIAERLELRVVGGRDVVAAILRELRAAAAARWLPRQPDAGTLTSQAATRRRAARRRGARRRARGRARRRPCRPRRTGARSNLTGGGARRRRARGHAASTTSNVEDAGAPVFTRIRSANVWKTSRAGPSSRGGRRHDEGWSCARARHGRRRRAHGHDHREGYQSGAPSSKAHDTTRRAAARARRARGR